MEQISILIRAKITLPEGMSLEDIQEKFENEVTSILINDDDETPAIELEFPEITEDNE